jgi:hypothetical protein
LQELAALHIQSQCSQFFQVPCCGESIAHRKNEEEDGGEVERKEVENMI